MPVHDTLVPIPVLRGAPIEFQALAALVKVDNLQTTFKSIYTCDKTNTM